MNRFRLRCLIATALACPLLLGAQTPTVRVDETAVRFSFSVQPLPGRAAYSQPRLPHLRAGRRRAPRPAEHCPLPWHCNLLPAHRNHGLQRDAAAGHTARQQQIPKARDGDSLSHFRVRYTVTPAGQPATIGIFALDHIAPSLFILHIATPKQIRPGSFYTVRIRATHPLTLSPQPNIALEATATASIDDTTNDLVVGRKHLVTDRNGFATLEFTAPSIPALDSVSILVDGKLANLHSSVEQEIKVPRQQSLTLTTDKPLYQPGQTVHLRLLSIDNHGHALAKSKLTLDVRDPDNTLVFRTEATTSHFGIASADWTIPARLRLGSYTIATHRRR